MVPIEKNIAILILAAGSSSRMGRPKQLLPWTNSTLLDHTIKNATLSCAKDVFLVLGANFEIIRKEIHHDDIYILVNTAWQSGLGSSIACGIQHILEERLNYDGLLVLLGDQPLIDTDYLNLMIAKFFEEKEGIIATAYKNGVGVPTLFAKEYFSELVLLRDDVGAKLLLNKSKTDIFKLAAVDKTQDIDTLKDYQKLKILYDQK